MEDLIVNITLDTQDAISAQDVTTEAAGEFDVTVMPKCASYVDDHQICKAKLKKIVEGDGCTVVKLQFVTNAQHTPHNLDISVFPVIDTALKERFYAIYRSLKHQHYLTLFPYNRGRKAGARVGPGCPRHLVRIQSKCDKKEDDSDSDKLNLKSVSYYSYWFSFAGIEPHSGLNTDGYVIHVYEEDGFLKVDSKRKIKSLIEIG